MAAQFFCDPGPCDSANPPPDGFRGATLWLAAAGVDFNLWRNDSPWQVKPMLGLGLARIVPNGQVAYHSPAETRPHVTTGVQFARQLAGHLDVLLNVHVRGIIGLNLTGLPHLPIRALRQTESTPASTVWSIPVTVGVMIPIW